MCRSCLVIALFVFCSFSKAAPPTAVPSATPTITEGRTLSLDSYLEQVRNSNQGVQGAALISSGAELRKQEGSLTVRPLFFAEANHISDQRPTVSVASQGNRTVTDTIAFGFSELTSFGLQSRLYYTITNIGVYGASPALVPQNQFYANGITLEFSQSLWRNAFGSATRASREGLNARALAQAYTQAFQGKTTVADAESRYWRLALAQEAVRVQREGLERTKSIRDFYSKRVRMQLADRSDLLQSDAAFRARELDFKLATDNARIARRAFNSARNIDSDEVSETLLPPDPANLNSLQVPERVEKREDVRAAEENVKATIASSTVNRNQYLPNLELFGAFSYNGRDPRFTESAHQSFTNLYPYTSVGLRFSVPLDAWTSADVRAGYAKEIQGAELTYQRRLFDQENDWKDLVQRFTESKERLAIALDLERAQLSKLQQEKRRRSQGQSTTYQVFLFEQDYLTSQINRIQTEGQILDLSSQMKTYQDTKRGNL